jgi:hypothetical protein
MNHYPATFWPGANHHPVSDSGQISSTRRFVSQLARNFRAHLSVLSIDPQEIFMFERDATGQKALRCI